MFSQTLVTYLPRKSKQESQRKVGDTSAVVGRKWKQDDGGGDVVETK
jgi:hypothetical protein